MPVSEGTIELELTLERRLRFRFEDGVWRVAIWRSDEQRKFQWRWCQGESIDPAVAVMSAFGRNQKLKIDDQIAYIMVERWAL